MSFHALAIVTCMAALLLGAGWLFAGRLMLQRWRIEPSVGALLVGRRIGAVYLGVALLCFLVRSTTSAELITSVSLFAVLVNALLAGLGLYEYRARRRSRHSRQCRRRTAAVARLRHVVADTRSAP